MIDAYPQQIIFSFPDRGMVSPYYVPFQGMGVRESPKFQFNFNNNGNLNANIYTNQGEHLFQQLSSNQQQKQAEKAESPQELKISKQKSSSNSN